MNSVVADWLRPWEFVSRACCWREQSDVFDADGKAKPEGGQAPASDDEGKIEPSAAAIRVCGQVIRQASWQECLSQLQFVR